MVNMNFCEVLVKEVLEDTSQFPVLINYHNKSNETRQKRNEHAAKKLCFFSFKPLIRSCLLLLTGVGDFGASIYPFMGLPSSLSLPSGKEEIRSFDSR